jgi:hypothetical protein
MFAAFVIPGHASVASSDAQLHIKNLALSPLDSDFAAQRKIALRFCRDVAPGMTMRYPCCRPGRHDRSGSRTFFCDDAGACRHYAAITACPGSPSISDERIPAD